MTFDSLDRGEAVATFGLGKLVQTMPGRLELRGGSPSDRSEAKEWISIFMPEAVLTERLDRPVKTSLSASSISR